MLSTTFRNDTSIVQTARWYVQLKDGRETTVIAVTDFAAKCKAAERFTRTGDGWVGWRDVRTCTRLP